MSILYGLYEADSGEILIDGKPVVMRNPRDALKAGIGMVHQHFMLVDTFTVLENVVLGAEAGACCATASMRRAAKSSGSGANTGCASIRMRWSAACRSASSSASRS